MNIIDRLVVTLMLDTKGFEQGRKKTDEELQKSRESYSKSTKNIEKDVKSAMVAFHKIRNEVIALGGAFLGLSAIKSFSLNLIELDRQAFYASKNLNMLPELLTKWQGAARQMGSSTEDITTSLYAVQRMAAEIHNLGHTAAMEGDSPLLRAGLDPSRFAQTASNSERMFMLARVFQKLTAEQALLWGQMGGLSIETITMLRQGPEAIAKSMSIIPPTSEKAAKAAVQMQNRIENLQNVARQLGRTFEDDLGPTVLSLAESFERWLVRTLTPERIEKLKVALKDFGEWLKNLDWEGVGKGILKIAEAAEHIADAVGGVMEVLKAFAAMGVGFMVGGPVGALVGLAAHLGMEGFESALEKYGKTDEFKKTASRPGYQGSGLDWTMKNLGGVSAGSSSTVTIQNLTINTQATDAKGVARDLRSAIGSQFNTVQQSNQGLR